MIILSIIAFLVLVVSIALYAKVLSPYLRILKLKAQFEKQGLKVLVYRINFFKENIIGTVNHFTNEKDDGLYFMKNQFQGYDIAIMNSFDRVVVAACSQKVVKEIYKTVQNLEKNDIVMNNFSRFLGGGLVMAENQSWKIKRKIYSEIFNFKLLEDLYPSLQQSSESFMKKWQNYKKMDSMQQFQKIFFNNFIVSYFGQDFQQFNYKGQQYAQSIVKIMHSIFQQSYTARNALLGTAFLQKGYFKEDRQISEHLKVVNEETRAFVKKKYDDFKKDKAQNKQRKTTIIEKVFQNKQFQNLCDKDFDQTIDSITGDILIFFFASTDTTASSTTVLLHLLNKHPQVLNKMRQQIQQKQGKINKENIKVLPYMDAVINETLRMYGPANWIFVRQVKNESFPILNVNVPKGVYIILQSYTLHFNQQFYDKPHEFNPQRWLQEKEKEKVKDTFSFISFGGGKRNCIGQHLARIEMKIALYNLISDYDFKIHDKLKMALPFVYLSVDNTFSIQRK